ncbi:hypothetical protein AAGS61_05890 [Lysinibacillus sp. KU-BSD001]|uniref:hypothetical protein n=1 Tax=Lysinibacillus sp. KU-BSD001 TaxID=3141328 RepID=UPI0036E5A4E9
MKMQELENYAARCLANKQPMQLFIEMPGFDVPELQVNPPENIEKKLLYIKDTYDENCEHKHAKGIRISGVAYEQDIPQGVMVFPTELLQGQVRYSQTTYVGDTSKDIVIEGSAEDVIKVYQSVE